MRRWQQPRPHRWPHCPELKTLKLTPQSGRVGIVDAATLLLQDLLEPPGDAAPGFFVFRREHYVWRVGA